MFVAIYFLSRSDAAEQAKDREDRSSSFETPEALLILLHFTNAKSPRKLQKEQLIICLLLYRMKINVYNVDKSNKKFWSDL